MNEYLKNNFTEEEIEILSCALLECSTYYTNKMLSYSISELEAQDVYWVQVFREKFDFNFKCKDVIDKFYSLLKERN